MDAAKLPLFYEPSIPRDCAGKAGLAWEGIGNCFVGSHGEELLGKAADRVAKQIGHGSFHIPTVYVDGRKVCPSTSDSEQGACDYEVVAKAIGQSPATAVMHAPLNLTYYFASK